MRIARQSGSWLSPCLKPCVALHSFPKLPKPPSAGGRARRYAQDSRRHITSLVVPAEILAAPRDDGYADQDNVNEEELPAVEGLTIDHGDQSTMSNNGRLTTFQELLFESDVLAHSGARARIIDHESKHHDYNLWTDLLRFKARYKGHEGAWEIFEGMRRRDVDLPTEGRNAAILWDTIVAAGMHLGKSRDIWQYSVDLHARTGRRYTKLYALIIGYYTPLKWQYALQSHERFRSNDLLNSNDIRTLVSLVDIAAFRSKRFRQLYLDSEDRHLYDLIMSRLTSSRHYRLAAMWHFILIEAKDFPSSRDIVQPLLRHSSDSGRYEEHERILASLREGARETKLTISEGTTALRAHLDTEATTYSIGASATVSDKFCARAFATRAFNPGVVIRTMSAFGVKSMGSLSLRELAVRCRDLLQDSGSEIISPNATLAREVTLHLDQLQTAGIVLEDSKFVKLVCTLARDGRGNLLDAVLSSDQHPDVYEDEALQTRLLGSYIYAEEWSEVHRTLAVLTLAHGNTATAGWNALLKAYMHHGSGPLQKKLQTVLATMHKLRIPITTDSIRHSYHTMLTPWRAGKLPTEHPASLQQLNLVTKMWLDILRHGSNVPASCWDYILRRYGAMAQYDELEHLCLWLAHHYSAPSSPAPDSPFRRRSTVQLNLIFRPMMQRAIAEWYFKSLQWPERTFPPKKPLSALSDLPSDSELRGKTLRSLNATETWARGLTLLRILSTLGVRIDHAGIYAACRHRLRILYGGGLSRRPQNRIAMEKNPHTLQRMLRYLRHVCRFMGDGGPTAQVPEELLQRFEDGESKEAAAEHQLRSRLFGHARPVDKRRRIRWLWKKQTMRMRYLDRAAAESVNILVDDGGAAQGDMDESTKWKLARDRYYYSELTPHVAAATAGAEEDVITAVIGRAKDAI